MINSLLLKIKYKLYVSVLFTSIPFVFASIFKFIVRGPNPGNSSLGLIHSWREIRLYFAVTLLTSSLSVATAYSNDRKMSMASAPNNVSNMATWISLSFLSLSVAFT